jgi:hypothetical protein
VKRRTKNDTGYEEINELRRNKSISSNLIYHTLNVGTEKDFSVV